MRHNGLLFEEAEFIETKKVWHEGRRGITNATVHRRKQQKTKSIRTLWLDNCKNRGLSLVVELPESDREDMEVFLEKMQQLLPALGVEALVPTAVGSFSTGSYAMLFCELKGLKASGYLTPNGIVVTSGSHAVLQERDSAQKYPWVVALRQRLKDDGSLVIDGDHLCFTKDTEFTSPSAAAAVIHGGTANGLTAWKNSQNKSLKETEAV